MTNAKTALKKNYHHGDLHTALLDEAVKMLLESGEESLSIRQLAARLGVSRTAPYHHFRDKQALLCAIAEEGFNRLHNTVFTPISASQSTSSQVELFIEGYLNFALENREFYDLMFSSRLWKSDLLAETLLQQARECFKSYLVFVERWQASGDLHSDIDSRRFAQITWSTMHGLSRLLIDGIYVVEDSVDAICETAKQIFWAT